MGQTKLIKAKHLAQKPYIEMVIIEELDGELVYIAMNPELEGCIAQGTGVNEAIRNLRNNRIAYILHFLENNLPIPDPQSTDSYVIIQDVN